MRAFQFRRTQRKYKTAYRVTNWNAYEGSLRRRGSLTVWIRGDAASVWCYAGRRRAGGQRVYSRAAIETIWTIAMIYRLPLRQTEGFVQSLFELADIPLPVPDHTTVSRRFRKLKRRPLPPPHRDQPIHLLVDSTGLTIHVGKSTIPPRRRGWRKIHVAVDREDGTIVASDLGANETRDAARVPALLNQVKRPLSSFSADTAYDRAEVYATVIGHSGKTRVLIPPGRNAKLDFGKRPALIQRDEHIWRVREIGRRAWYLESGFTKRSTVENVIYRYKSVLGREMKARTLAGQRIEARLGCLILNRMASLGMPETQRVD